MKISGIIFDKDGTLLDFNEFWIPAAQCVIRRILSDYKIPVTDIHNIDKKNAIKVRLRKPLILEVDKVIRLWHFSVPIF